MRHVDLGCSSQLAHVQSSQLLIEWSNHRDITLQVLQKSVKSSEQKPRTHICTWQIQLDELFALLCF